MSDPFLAEIRIFPFDFPPKNWAFCDGQLMPISQNTALFSILGTFYGGDGKSTFALPGLQGKAPMQPGQGQGLSDRFLGQEGGAESITLLQSEIPVHTHLLSATSNDGEFKSPAPDRVMGRSINTFLYQTTASSMQPMAFQTLAPAGGGLPHNNMQPYLTLNFSIALLGDFPNRP